MATDIVNKVYRDLKYSASKFSKLHREIKDDIKFEQGEQWIDSDIQTLKTAGVKALTINKLKPIIKLITGIERQSRSDFKAFPEGGEDELVSEMVSRLIKNVVKNSKVEVKLSEQFKSGAVGGMSFLEPYIDYSFDIINGDLKFKRLSSLDCYFDPDFQEYDLSDSKFFIKITKDLSKDDLITLFPDKEKKINELNSGKINFEQLENLSVSVETDDYPDSTDKDSIFTDYEDNEKPSFDLIDYFYKESQDKYFVFEEKHGIVKQLDDKAEALLLAEQINGQVITKKVPVVMHSQVVGTEELYNGVCWCYPKWKNYPIMPYFAELVTENIDDFSLKIQGIVRGIKDLQEEYNKRRTQELRHLNSSANSGFDVEEGQLSEAEKAKLKKYGSSPGIVIERKKGSPPINRITPMPLSQGHAQLAEENAQDLKEASGVNPDLLANDSQSQSGRAILLKQRQGLVMVQEMLDNLSETKRITGKFILSQLKELFTIDNAMRVLGDAFIKDNFTVPTSEILIRGIKKVEEGREDITPLENSVMLQYPGQNPQQPILDETGNFQTMVDFDTALQTIDSVLNNAEIGKYDIEIGEGPYQDTIRLANFMDLKDLAQQGVPIPPQTLIEMSMIPKGEKNKIFQQLAQQQQMAMAQEAKPQSKETMQ